MTDELRRLGAWLLVATAIWHLLAVLSPAWVLSFDHDKGRDFASYYYAVKVGAEGGDPYNRVHLNQAARLDGVREGVHPFLYAPPFLLALSWVKAFDLGEAFHIWFWLHELCALAAAFVLWRWWRPLSPVVGWVIVALFALMTAIPNNHAMGQANFPGLFLALLGLWQTERGRPVVGGALMGLACMLKMSPALFVVWWLIRKQWTAVAAAVGAGVVLSLMALPFAGPSVQWRFYTQILPTFSSGEYNGLAVSIQLFGNHSVPNLLDAWLPSPTDALSPAARAVSALFSLGSLAALAWAFWEGRPDALARAAQSSAFGVLLLLIPVYTYEHHLVFALPAATIAIVGACTGRLDPRWVVPVGLCVGLLLFDLQTLKGMAEGTNIVLAAILREVKFVALLGLLAACVFLGRSPPEAAA
jgi:alpha-1,2-mannosyltransferase